VMCVHVNRDVRARGCGCNAVASSLFSAFLDLFMFETVLTIII